jgi:hypothetical protein
MFFDIRPPSQARAWSLGRRFSFGGFYSSAD